MAKNKVGVWATRPTHKSIRTKTHHHDRHEEKEDKHLWERAASGFTNCSCSIYFWLGCLIVAFIVCVIVATAVAVYEVNKANTSSSLTDSTTSGTASTSNTATTVSSTTMISSTATILSSSSSIFTNSTLITTTTTTTTTTAPYCLTRVTFDDIPSQSATSGVVPNGYKNLNWTNTFYLNVSTQPTSGYQYIMGSSPYIAYNPGGVSVNITTANGTRFSFDSILVNSAWRDNLLWTIDAYTNGALVVSGSFYMQVLNQTTISCGVCTDLDTLYMSVSGGTPHTGLNQTGKEFGFDDLCISFGY